MFIRPATEADRAAILSLMRPGDFNRVNLRPACFLVAEDGGQVIGIGQIKRHRDGTPELASLVVAADRRGKELDRRWCGRWWHVMADRSISSVWPNWKASIPGLAFGALNVPIYHSCWR